MGIYENVKKAAELRHTTINKIEKDLSLPRSSIAKFNAHIPAADKLLLIADYLNVSVESLIRPPEAHAIIDNIRTTAKALQPIRDAFMEEFQKDPVFMEHIRLLWSLEGKQKSEAYTFIEYQYYKTNAAAEEKKEAIPGY